MSEERDFYLLAYDIADDRRRARIAKLMESLGARVQGSVFEAYLNAAELAGLLKKAEKRMSKDEDSLRVYPLCRACLKRVLTRGRSGLTEAPKVTIV